jgi:hypothetical protein
MAAQDQRPRFYEGQYLAADDVAAIVEYARVQTARHELGGHSWGIVVGLGLVERDTLGAPKQKLVYITPGFAEDGFGRKLLALSPARLPETLFANIAYAADVDDPKLNNNVPPGRFVKVWLAYDERSGQAPPPGFAACDAGDSYARVQETYRFVIGDPQPLSARHSPVSVAGQRIDATLALRTFDPKAPVLADASIPHQQYPDDNRSARWLVPIGVVRWVVKAGSGGYFVDRDIDEKDLGSVRIRRMRTYSGAIAETVNAIDGALVLRNRGDDPLAEGRFQAQLQSSQPLEAVRKDLVWVEGNLRVVGDARLPGSALRLAGSVLRFADLSGDDKGTPLSLERTGDSVASPGQRSLLALIGPDAQADNRFAVATVVKENPRQLAEKLTLLSSGNVGVGTPAPAEKLHVEAGNILVDGEGNGVIVDAAGHKRVGLMKYVGKEAMLIGSSKLPTPIRIGRCDGGTVTEPGNIHEDIVIDSQGNVGIGTTNPTCKLDVTSANGIKLGLQGKGGGALYITNDLNDNMVYLEFYNKTGDGTAGEAFLTGHNGGNLPRLNIRADVTYNSGNVGIGTNTPKSQLHINVPASSTPIGALTVDVQSFRTQANAQASYFFRVQDIGAIGLPPHFLIRGDGRVGIGTDQPAAKLHVHGDIVAANYLFENSDEALKHEVRPMTDASSMLKQLRGVRFKWKTPAELERPDAVGVIAQDVAKVLPEAVRTIDGYGAVSHSALVAVLIEATKELKQENDALRAELDDLKKAVGALKARLDAQQIEPVRRPTRDTARARRKRPGLE